MDSFSNSYKTAGVDVTAGYKAVELMKKHVSATMTHEVLTDIGGFGGLVMPDLSGIEQPVLVSGTDGVGTKLKLAFLLDKHDTVGIDCVAMCVNDIICSGARPLFFLDYIACGKNKPEKIAEIVKGVSDGCIQSGCALIGGETAEMPGFYDEDEYDMAGFAVGIVDKKAIINGADAGAGDILIGLASSGIHSNGFSLVRKVFGIDNRESLNRRYSELDGTLGETLLTPTRIYVKALTAVLKAVRVKAVSHITGGGFYENIPRMLPDGTVAVLDTKAYEIPPIFDLLQKEGNIPARDMYNTFNMGIGMVLCVDKKEADTTLEILRNAGEKAYVLGHIEAGTSGEKGIKLC